MTDDSLISAKQPDGFTTESPIRAFTDFSVNGLYAIGKGFRPSLGHFSAYLDAMEAKEGWALVQIILPTVDGRDPTVIFRRKPRVRWLLSDKLGEMYEPESSKNAKAFVTDEPDDYRNIVDDPVVPDMGAPHDTLLNVKVKSNFGKTHVSSAAYMKERWWFVTHMDGDNITATEPMRGYPDAWQRPGEDRWITAVAPRDPYREVAATVAGDLEHEWPRPIGKSPALGEPYTPEREMTIRGGVDGWMVEEFLKKQGLTVVVHKGVASIFRPHGDDPVNPKHYGGTACAEIGERLSANSYQVLKYNWRLGEKDEEKTEIGKAIWYLDREVAMHNEYATGGKRIFLARDDLPPYQFFDHRLKDATEWAQIVARALISWNRYGNVETLRGLRRKLVSHKSMQPETGTGMAV